METLLAILINAASRKAYLHGREYLVAPVTAIVPGVLDGSDGPLLYPAEEVAKSAPDWNHVPIVAPKHPVDNAGNPVSARDPEFLEKYGVGMVLRSKFSDKLTAEAWFDVEACNRVDKRLLPKVKSGKPLEVSTGLFLQKTPVANGVTDSGKKYGHITHGYKPDHLAILLDEKGACTVEDGCGVHVNSAEKPTDNAKLSHSRIREILQEELNESHGVKQYSDGYTSPICWVVEVFDRKFVYSKGEELYEQEYRTDNRTGELSVVGDPVEVHRMVSYKPVTNEGSGTMNRDATINWLVTNCDCWKGADAKEVLNKASDETLKNLKKKAEDVVEIITNSANQIFTDSLGNSHVWDAGKKAWVTKPKEEKKEPPVVNQQAQQITMDNLPAELREDIEFARRIKTEQKNRHIAVITANTQNKFTQQQLEQMPLSVLENMAAIAAPAQPAQPQHPAYGYPSYGGAAVPPVHNSGNNGPYASYVSHLTKEDAEVVAVAPVINWSELRK